MLSKSIVFTIAFLVASPLLAMSWQEHYEFGCELYENGQRDMAWRHFWDALAIAKKNANAKHLARTYMQLGDLQYDAKLQGKSYIFYTSARQAWEKELDIRKIYDAWRAPQRSWLGLKLKHNEVRDWIDYERVLTRLSDLALKLNKKKLAARIAKRHMNITEIRLGKNSEEYGWALNRYAKFLFHCDLLKKSEVVYRKALRTMKDRAHSAHIAQIQKELATVLRAMDKEIEAELYEKKAKSNLSFENVWGTKQKSSFTVTPPKGVEIKRPLAPSIYCEIPQETTGGVVAFSPDGNTIATYSGGKKGAVHFWSVKNKNWLYGFALPNTYVGTATFSVDGIHFYAGTSEGVKRWLLDIKKELPPLKASGNNFVFSMAQSRKGDYLAVATSTEVGTLPVTYIWITKTGTVLHQLRGHKSSVTSLACSDMEDFLATGGSDGKIMIWNLLSGELLQTIRKAGGTIGSMCFLKDKLYSVGDKGAISCWNWRKGQIVTTLPAQGDRLQTITILPQKQMLLAGGYDAKIRLWDLKQEKVVKTFRDHGQTVWHLAVSPAENIFASFGMDSRVLIWKID